MSYTSQNEYAHCHNLVQAIRAEDLERRRMLEADSGSESLSSQSVNLSLGEEAEEQDEGTAGRRGDTLETSGDSEGADSSSTNGDSRGQQSSGDLPKQSVDHQLVTSGLAGIRAARVQLRKISREKSARRRHKMEADDASRSAAAEGWGLRYTLDSMESGGLEEDEEKEEHLRFAEPLKTKYMKTRERKRHVRQ